MDPISLVIKKMPIFIRCSRAMPARWKIGGMWYCKSGEDRPLEDCHAAEDVPIEPVQLDVNTPSWDLGKSIYNKKDLDDYYAFQDTQNARAAFISKQSQLAYQGR